MKIPSFLKDRMPALRIVAVYALFGGLWILLSDILMGLITSDAHLLERISLFKGLVFILITAILLFHLINRYIRRAADYADRLRSSADEREKMELQASFFRTLIEFSRDPFYVLDPADGYRMVYANRAACEHYGLPLEQLQTMRIPDWDPAFDMAAVDALLQEMRKGKQARLESVHKVASGRLVQVELTSSFLVHDGKEYTCGYFYDITERKAMEEALRESEARYRGLFLEFQALLEGIPDGLTLLSPDLKVLWANHSAALATGHEPGELIGRQCYEMRHSRDIPCEACIVLETFRTGELLETTVFSEKTSRTFELRSVPVRDERGQVIKVIEIGRDVTDQKTAEAERIELERKLLHAQKLESLGILAGGIAHDFNNILTGISGNLSMIRMLIPEGHKGLELIGRCEKAVSQATGLTCQLLTFSKGGDPVKKPTDLRQLLENSVSFALTGSNLAAEVIIADDLWPVEADVGQLGQVINNLLINAAQAMPDGGVVRVSAANRLRERQGEQSVEDRHVSLSISDQGVGITPENLERIFDPYFTTKKGGTGLGLTSVYSIVRKHGGDISVVSEPGKGTTFEILLPASGQPVESHSSRVHQGVAAGKGLILVMDDEEYIRDMVCEMLSMLGYDSEGYSRGEDLVQKYMDMVRGGEAPAAVILDLTIRGGMGGLEAAKTVLDFDPSARLIVASGYSTNPVMADYRRHGFKAALAKPYRLEDVSCELDKVLRGEERAG